jgi:hypothetical protein
VIKSIFFGDQNTFYPNAGVISVTVVVVVIIVLAVVAVDVVAVIPDVADEFDVVAVVAIKINGVVAEFVSFSEAEEILSVASKSATVMFILEGDSMCDSVALKEPSAVLGFRHLLINVTSG